ncbi:MAG: SAM-dependent methyltransferase [Deltaproteobacteria bacterium]|nr:SAM-dependent methyltransferase [Deltaproteobacteria bacterium]
MELLGPCRLLADVGTDHGLVPVAAVESGRAERALAIDVLRGPLAVAARTVRAAGMSDRVSLLHSDGLTGLAGRGVDAVVVAGMSGKTMQRICEAAPEVVAELEQLVVQPNGGAQIMRAFARRAGFHLTAERMVYERGQYFVTCRFSRRDGPDPAYDDEGLGLDEAEAFELGPLLLRRRDAVARDYYLMQRARLAGLVEGGAPGRAEELALFERAVALCSGDHPASLGDC